MVRSRPPTELKRWLRAAPFAAGVAGQGVQAVRIEVGRTSGPATTPFVSESAPKLPVQRAPALLAIAGVVIALGVGLSMWMAGDGEEAAAAAGEHIAAPALPAAPPEPALRAAPAPAAPEPETAPPAPDAGVAAAPPTVSPAESPHDPRRSSGRDKRPQAPQPPVEESAPTGPNKGSGRSGTITTDDF